MDGGPLFKYLPNIYQDYALNWVHKCTRNKSTWEVVVWWEMSPIGTGIWAFGLWLVVQFEEV